MTIINNNINYMELKKVALDEVHQALGAKMVEFAGYNMPVRYSSDKEEHMTVREGVGIFDVSHMGEFFIEGPNALTLIQQITSNDASKLSIGQAQYSCFPNETGGIVDDLLVYKIEEDKYMLVVNASNIKKDWDWISKHNNVNATLENRSDQLSLFAVQGPSATQALQSLTQVNLEDMKYYTFCIDGFAGAPNVIISATGYTGAGGFELYVENQYAKEVWNKIMQAGESFGIKPIGLGARDTLRLEKGFCLYGNDIDDNTSPHEAGLGWITKYSKTFINSENLQKQKSEGVNKKLIGFVMVDKGIPRHGYPILDLSGEVIGEVTSGSISPVLNVGIGLGYVDIVNSKTDSEILVEVRNKHLKARVTKLPFV
jgi:aminomethyltransferase